MLCEFNFFCAGFAIDLVLLGPRIMSLQPAGNYYDKYNTVNPIARRLMRGFLSSFGELVALAGTPSEALEVGCGEGELSMRMDAAGWRVQACDIAEDAVQEARRRINAARLNIPVKRADVRDIGGCYRPVDLVVCCEVLEHLDSPEQALQTLLALSRRYVLVSVPREPIWRMLNVMRGSYWTDLGNTPGHIQHWSRREFLAMLSDHAEVVHVRNPLPWTIALCRAR
ncbi:class I SAM-dependent methyltransferase [Xanthomonas cissicola]|nr:class I SAM-dependent methyltransferase [Xanthomonas cissicola]